MTISKILPVTAAKSEVGIHPISRKVISVVGLIPVASKMKTVVGLAAVTAMRCRTVVAFIRPAALVRSSVSTTVSSVHAAERNAHMSTVSLVLSLRSSK